MDDGLVARLTTKATLRDGTTVVLRPIVPDDKARLAEGFERLSPESRYRRFFSSVPALSDRQLAYLTELDYVDHFALVAAALPEELGVGVARYIRLQDERTAAEAAVAVADDFQHRGLGHLLLDGIAAVALGNGIRAFHATVLWENEPMRKLLRDLGARSQLEDGGTLRYIVDLPERVGDMRGTPLYHLLQAAGRGHVAVRGPAQLS